MWHKIEEIHVCFKIQPLFESSTDVKASMPTRDKNKSLDERCDNSANTMSNETSGNGQSNQNGVKNKMS